MSKKLQIFISSTYEDLKEKRAEIVHAILELGHIPAGMELFGQEEQGITAVVKKWIDESDVYLLVIGNRYGSICPDRGISYTQLEYEYARERNKKMIKIITQERIDQASCDNYELLTRFVDQVRDGNTITSVRGDINLGARMADIINQYVLEIEGGWFRHADINEYRQKYELIQFLFFAEDNWSACFNRFNALPKILMLMDQRKHCNPVSIGELLLRYTIESNRDSAEPIYNGMREWEMRNVRNISGKELHTYYFYTTTDIGKRDNARVLFLDCGRDREIVLDTGSNKNNGISCWKWRIMPSINNRDLFDNMRIHEDLSYAWDFRKYVTKEGIEKNKHEIVYFAPRSFAIQYDVVSFEIAVDENVGDFNMYLCEISSRTGVPRRKVIGELRRGSLIDGKRAYNIRMDGTVDMDSIYYVFIEVRQ